MRQIHQIIDRIAVRALDREKFCGNGEWGTFN